MPEKEQRGLSKKQIVGALLYAGLILLILIFIQVDRINAAIMEVLILLRPVLLGLVLSYLCNPLFCLLERRVFFRLRPQGLRRTLSLLCTYLAFLLLIATVLVLILPQMLQSIVDFVIHYEDYVSGAIAQVNGTIEQVNHLLQSALGSGEYLNPLDEEEINLAVSEFFTSLAGGEVIDSPMDLLDRIDLEPIKTAFGKVTSWAADIIFAIFVSIYLLSSKEKRYAQVMKLRRALFSKETNERITHFCTTADRTFGVYLQARSLDSLIVALLLYVAFLLLDLPYALTMAFFLGIMNFIPLIGLFLGVIPVTLILLLSDPVKLLPFLLVIVIVQQIDGNIIAPKIMGSNTGVSMFCVLLSISVMSAFWGVVGMLLAVPLFATIVELTESLTVERLQKKGFPSGVENYYSADSIVDPVTDANRSIDPFVQFLEKRATHRRVKRQAGEPLSRFDRAMLAFNDMLHKRGIIPEPTAEEEARYLSREVLRAAEEDAELSLQSPIPTPPSDEDGANTPVAE